MKKQEKTKKKSFIISGLARFIPYYKPYLGTFVCDMLCSLGVTASDLAFPMLVRHLMNNGLSEVSGVNLDVIWKTALLILLLKVADVLCNYYVNSYGHVMGARMETDMRTKLFAHLEKLSFSYYDNVKIGQLMSRITNDLFDITEFAHHCPEEFLIAGIKIVGSFIILSTISFKVTLVIFACLPFMFAFSLIYSKKMRSAFKEQRTQIGEINAEVEDSLAGIRVVKSFANEDLEKEKFDRSNKKFLSIKRKTYRYMGVFHSGIRFFNSFMYLTVVVAGALFIVAGEITLVDLTAYILYVTTLLNSISTLVSFTEQLQRGLTGFHRYLEILDTPADIADSPNATDIENVQGNISFENVDFKYGENLSEVLSHISMTVNKGEKIAIVGPSGGGKTTICSLIPRFYDVTGGRITLDGKDIRDITLKSLRSSIGVVQQDVYLFAGTIRENIEYGKPGASFEEIVEAAKSAGAHDFICSLDNGYDTYVGERGVRLSGGQKQRISIARVFLKNPPVLVLDEATSALDNESEKIVQRSLDTLAEGRTTFIIAHRLTTVRNATKILVLTENGIKEAGTHDELISKNGIYSKLYELYSV
jgi:ATP-binding cassette subfamily B protein